MVEVFKFNHEKVGETYYIRPIPIMWEKRLSFSPIFSFYVSSVSGFIPPQKYISYFIINGELKLHVYGNAIKKHIDLEKFVPITKDNVLRVNVASNQGFLDLSDCKIKKLERCDIDYKEKYMIKNVVQYT